MSWFSNLFGILMAVSFLFLMGIFNYTETNHSRAWNGFPYRLFSLPIPTWQMVALPMISCVVAVEALYLAWIKLVWTRDQIEKPEWFAVVFGAYAIFYLSTLWTLAPFRIGRLIALGMGGASSVALACLPFMPVANISVWLSEKRLILLVASGAAAAYLIAWMVVARQRHGRYQQRNWVKALFFQVIDAAPNRTKDFRSSSAALFWFEWRQTGWLLPVCTTSILIFIVLPVTWFDRMDPVFTLVRILSAPMVLGFAIGRGFIKPSFWSANLAFPTFLGVKPVTAYEFVLTKLKVAALGVTFAWAQIFIFIALWMNFWANTLKFHEYLYFLRDVYPHSWWLLLLLVALCLVALTWKLMVAGLWHGLSGKRFLYFGSFILPFALGVVALIVGGLWEHTVKAPISAHRSQMISVISVLLAVAVVAKFMVASIFWSRNDCSKRYLAVWAALTASGVLLAMLSSSIAVDTYRTEHLLVLLAFLSFPLVRPGLASLMLGRNRHNRFDSLHKLNKPVVFAALLLGSVAVVLGMDLGRFKFNFVDVGGHEIRMLVTGKGGPAVVFETGARGSGGAPLETWDKVQFLVSSFTTAVTYDRAGVGLSAPGPAPRDARQIALELHAALGKAGMAPPYVLVGHSFGGPFIRVFAGLYPEEVCGMILVDPTQEEFINGNQTNRDEQIPSDDWKLIQSGLAEAHASRIPDNIPVYLITGMGPRVFPEFVTEQQKQEYKTSHQALLKWHTEWLKKLPNAHHIITENSGHGVPLTEPALIADAIRETIKQVRVAK